MGTRGRCSYCLREATTKDHVVPRCLLEKPYPPNLLTIPSCCECNTGFKQDEDRLPQRGMRKGAVLQPSDPRQGFQGFRRC